MRGGYWGESEGVCFMCVIDGGVGREGGVCYLRVFVRGGRGECFWFDLWGFCGGIV